MTYNSIIKLEPMELGDPVLIDPTTSIPLPVHFPTVTMPVAPPTPTLHRTTTTLEHQPLIQNQNQYQETAPPTPPTPPTFSPIPTGMSPAIAQLLFQAPTSTRTANSSTKSNTGSSSSSNSNRSTRQTIRNRYPIVPECLENRKSFRSWFDRVKPNGRIDGGKVAFERAKDVVVPGKSVPGHPGFKPKIVDRVVHLIPNWHVKVGFKTIVKFRDFESEYEVEFYDLSMWRHGMSEAKKRLLEYKTSRDPKEREVYDALGQYPKQIFFRDYLLNFPYDARPQPSSSTTTTTSGPRNVQPSPNSTTTSSDPPNVQLSPSSTTTTSGPRNVQPSPSTTTTTSDPRNVQPPPRTTTTNSGPRNAQPPRENSNSSNVANHHQPSTETRRPGPSDEHDNESVYSVRKKPRSDHMKAKDVGKIGEVLDFNIDGDKLDFVIIPKDYKLKFRMESWSLLEAKNGPEALQEYLSKLNADRFSELVNGYPKIFRMHIKYFQDKAAKESNRQNQ